MGEPLLFGAVPDNVPGDHQYIVKLTIGSTGSAATWLGYGVDITRPSSTTLKLQFGKPYITLMDFGQGRFPVSAASQVAAIVTTDNMSADGSITLTFVSGGSATAPASGDVFFFRFIMTSDQLNAAFQGSCT